MSETARMTGGPLDGQQVELHPVQTQNGEYGVLSGWDTGPCTPAYVRRGARPVDLAGQALARSLTCR